MSNSVKETMQMISDQLIDNNTGQITPAVLRAVLMDMCSTLSDSHIMVRSGTQTTVTVDQSTGSPLRLYHETERSQNFVGHINLATAGLVVDEDMSSISIGVNCYFAAAAGRTGEIRILKNGQPTGLTVPLTGIGTNEADFRAVGTRQTLTGIIAGDEFTTQIVLTGATPTNTQFTFKSIRFNIYSDY